MAAIVTINVKNKKCATCNWWCGKRAIEFRNNKPFYVNAEANAAECTAQKGQAKTPGNVCSRWTLWESLSNVLAWNNFRGLISFLARL